MASKDERLALNVAGAYYVDESCVDCGACPATAPGNFRRCDDTGTSYVYRQPETELERSLCREALEGCPTESIGDNGDET
ncbi:MAG: ferredoxin [Sumerlaeia bacterium]